MATATDDKEADPTTDADDGSLLGRFRGERPEASAWFAEAIAVEPSRSTFASGGVDIELLTWGEIGKPGLLFLHGNGAHADWWSFIAPYFARDYRCAAISWSGMGGSGWREAYDLPTFGAEACDAIAAAGLDRASVKPVAIAHSFGGMPLMQVGAHHADRIAGGIMVDSFVPPPDRKPRWTTRGAPTRRYPQLADALARYRFAPEQDSQWPEVVDHLARTSLRWMEADAHGEAGWTWKFDPTLWATMDRTGADALLERVDVPVALIFGEESLLVRAEAAQAMQARLRNCPIAIAIPHARHHIMVDQPIALVAALRVAVQAIAAVGDRK
ncbi:alpha/beta hydrolase [Sphingomonas gilva]|uniref:Alpha/beta hydrolase n=1 Tax=Sphingomonas gilva TaxID=2305907 RepID=A0A396RXR5_9SPHN|nr:alpha/beta hydrolase [Sphingomonas gilva]RHW19263.1 alpha/beta hydrolase [Sphingomonas gilva]